MQKLKKKLLDNNDSIARTPEDALRDWQDELDDIDRENSLQDYHIHTIKIEVNDEELDEWYKYINKFNEHLNKCKIRPTWHDMFMQIAEVVAKRSKDPHTKVGAVIVKDNHILGIGYNAEPKGFVYEFDWHSEEKYEYVIHAELNAIANSTYFGNSIVGSTIYLTLSPCHECMKLLIQYGIHTIYYKTKYKDFDKTEKMAKYSNISLIQYTDN